MKLASLQKRFTVVILPGMKRYSPYQQSVIATSTVGSFAMLGGTILGAYRRS